MVRSARLLLQTRGKRLKIHAFSNSFLSSPIADTLTDWHTHATSLHGGRPERLNKEEKKRIPLFKKNLLVKRKKPFICLLESFRIERMTIIMKIKRAPPLCVLNFSPSIKQFEKPLMLTPTHSLDHCTTYLQGERQRMIIFISKENRNPTY